MQWVTSLEGRAEKLRSFESFSMSPFAEIIEMPIVTAETMLLGEQPAAID
jgi:hypothetical protein